MTAQWQDVSPSAGDWLEDFSNWILYYTHALWKDNGIWIDTPSVWHDYPQGQWQDTPDSGGGWIDAN